MSSLIVRPNHFTHSNKTRVILLLLPFFCCWKICVLWLWLWFCHIPSITTTTATPTIIINIPYFDCKKIFSALMWLVEISVSDRSIQAISCCCCCWLHVVVSITNKKKRKFWVILWFVSQSHHAEPNGQLLHLPGHGGYSGHIGSRFNQTIGVHGYTATGGGCWSQHVAPSAVFLVTVRIWW